MLPYIMAQKKGVLGFVLGFSMGIGGAIFKPAGGESPGFCPIPLPWLCDF